MTTQPRIYTKIVTPEEAQKFLSHNEGNRKLSDKNVQFLYQQMVNGQWKFTGDSLKFNGDGRMMDGQNRMHALVKFGKPLEFLIVEGLESSIFTVLDTGKNRSAGDILSIKGY